MFHSRTANVCSRFCALEIGESGKTTCWLCLWHEPSQSRILIPRTVRIPRFITIVMCRLLLKRDGTLAETGFRLSPKRTSPFKWAGVSVQSTADSRGLRISGSNAGYAMFRGSVKSTGYPLHSPVSPSLSPPVRHRVPSGFKRTLVRLVQMFRLKILKNVYEMAVTSRSEMKIVCTKK